MITSKDNIHRRLFYDMKWITLKAEKENYDYVSVWMSDYHRYRLSDRDFKKFKKYWDKKGWIFQRELEEMGGVGFILKKEKPIQHVKFDWNYSDFAFEEM